MMELEKLSTETDAEGDRYDNKQKDGADPEEADTERRLRYAKQILIILGTTIAYQNKGMSLSWPNTFASDLQVDRTTLFNTTLEVKDWQMDMMSSAHYIGLIPSTIVSSWFVSRTGRKRCMMLSVIPIGISWVVVTLALNTTMLLIGRFLFGVGAALVAVAVRPYLVEVSDTNIRGAAGVSAEAMKGTGSIIIIALGIVLPWYYLAAISCIHFLVYALVIVPFLPESPTYLVVSNRTEEANEVLRFLKGPYADLDVITEELKRQNERNDGSEGWGVLLKKDALKKCSIVLGLFLIANFCGSEVIRGNATRMLQSSGLALDKEVSTIIVFAVLLSGNVAQIFVLDRIGRRKCLVLSLTLLMISYGLLGTFVYVTTPAVEVDPLLLNENRTDLINNFIAPNAESQWKWVPTACLMVAAFSLSLGIGPIPWLLSTEYFPTNIRPKVLSVCIVINSFLAVIALQLYSPLQKFLTPAGLFWSYSFSAGIGILYTLLFVYETKGVSIG